MEEGRRPGHAVAALLLVAACGGSDAPPSAPRVGHMLAAVFAAAEQTKAPWRCATSDTPALADTALTTGARKWQLGGHMLRRIDSDDTIAIGVFADAANATPKTIAALARLRGELDKATPDLVLALGGMGGTQAELEATLATLGEHAGYPIIALPGDLEDVRDHAAAISALRKRGIAVIDGRLVRWIELPGATIATLPGAGARERLVADDEGCHWRADDVAKIYGELTARPGIRVVASAEAPRTSVDGEPAGELGLVPPQAVEVALHGPVSPAPSPVRSGSRDGARVLLSPGTADGVRRLPDPHAPSAGLLILRNGSWSWRPIAQPRAK